MRVQEALLRLPLRFDAAALAAEVEALPPAAWRPHPNQIPGNEAAFLVTTGGGLNEDLTGPMAPTEFLRACPYLLRTMAAIGAVWGRCRLMRVGPGATVPPHVDTNFYWRRHVRIHVPIITGPGVRFTVAGTSVHMAAGECWVFDTFAPHDVVNGWSGKRTHLVCDTVGGEELWALMEAARAGAPVREVPVAAGSAEALAFEGRTSTEVMSPWELRYHLDFIAERASPAARAAPAFAVVEHRLARFHAAWHSAWAQHGPAPAGFPAYARAIAALEADLPRLGGETLRLDNGLFVYRQIAEILHTLGLALTPPPAAQPVRLRA